MRLPKLPPPPKLRSPSPPPLPAPTPPLYLEELQSLQVVPSLEELLLQAPLFSAPPLRHLSNQQAISSQRLHLLDGKDRGIVLLHLLHASQDGGVEHLLETSRLHHLHWPLWQTCDTGFFEGNRLRCLSHYFSTVKQQRGDLCTRVLHLGKCTHLRV